MKKVLTKLSLLLIQNLSALGQTNTFLAKKIDSLTFEDQKWRGLIRQIDNNEVDIISREIVSKNLRVTDSLNFIIIKQLFEADGFLGYDKVAQKASNNFWLLV